MNKSPPTSDRTTRKDTPSVVAAVTIRSLPGEWRKVHCAVNKCSDSFYCCAFDLEAVLPVWTKISDDPETWPKKREYILGIDNTEEEKFPEPFWVEPDNRLPSYVTHWRPLCDLDTP